MPKNDPKVHVVIIHGSHTHKPGVDRETINVGEALELPHSELMALDPHFKNGIGHRFASPEKASKLMQKAKLEAELAEDDSEAPEVEATEADEPDEAPVEKPKKAARTKKVA